MARKHTLIDTVITNVRDFINYDLVNVIIELVVFVIKVKIALYIILGA